MIELTDNVIQLMATVVGFIWTGMSFSKSRKQPFFLLTCFYGSFALGTLYWTIHLLLIFETPAVFYVSEFGWIAGYTFLLALLYAMRTPAQRRQKTLFCLLAPVFCIPQFVLYITHGDVIINLVMCTFTMLIEWFAIDGLVFSLRGLGGKDTVAFYISTLCFVVLEYCLWTASCFWMGDVLANPYFWFDFLLSASILSLFPGLRKAVMT